MNDEIGMLMLVCVLFGFSLGFWMAYRMMV